MPPSSPPVPFAYRLMFHWFEPTMATLGALNAIIAPSPLVRMTLPSLYALRLSPPANDMTTALAPLLTHCAGSWTMLAFHDAVTLRVFSADWRAWSAVLSASLLSDVGYTVGLVQAMGVAGFFGVGAWDAERAFVVLSTVVPMMFKVGFLLGVGLPDQQPLSKRSE